MSWEISELSTVARIGDGAHASLKRVEIGIPYLTAKNLTKTGIDYSNLEYISKETYDKHFKEKSSALTKPIKGDILYSIIGSIGGVYVVQDEIFGISSSVAIIRANSEIVIPEYLAYFIKSNSFDARIQSIKGGVAQGFMSLGKLGTVKISYPKDIGNQKCIVKILSAYDNLIENNNKQIKLLEEAAQKLYKEWFIDLHFPGYENTEIIDGVPAGWVQGIVDSKIKFLNGYAFKSKDFDETGLYKIVTIKNVKDGQFDGDNVNHIVDIPSKLPEHCKLTDGDILLSLTGNVGRVCLVVGENYLLNQRVAKLESEFPAYTYCLFRSHDMFVKMNNLANGAAQQNLSPVKTGQIRMYFPTDELLHQFENIVQGMIEKILLLNKQCIKLTEARDRLLPKLMNGEIEF